jgi:hypothetical protein
MWGQSCSLQGAQRWLRKSTFSDLAASIESNEKLESSTKTSILRQLGQLNVATNKSRWAGGGGGCANDEQQERGGAGVAPAAKSVHFEDRLLEGVGGLDAVPFGSPRWWAPFRAMGACRGTQPSEPGAATRKGKGRGRRQSPRGPNRNHRDPDGDPDGDIAGVDDSDSESNDGVGDDEVQAAKKMEAEFMAFMDEVVIIPFPPFPTPLSELIADRMVGFDHLSHSLQPLLIKKARGA